MKSAELLDLCLALPGAEETDPWGEGGGVLKVGGKIFAFVGSETLGVKVARSTDEAREWYDRYPDHVSTMAYIGRHGWITVRHDDGVVPDDELEELVDISYTAVVAGLPKRLRPEG
ncbi:putative DNA-binding protein (MmcQ/YjbR family) [Promicromonospora sp. AC04]|uniref:MmcQ/YjbR family DNA-binding protein n=1 Tax=Promicromonospora sp. AC04 TaxID=2135723 RepID=UPI000D3AA615|nr:MmcQ/YjbR family DNA-binding protein [Promicromonospora sp. AC04]PUB27071.1 putative DNA-binding protein (MmcQ/YjbR family) [Promicromonospora sp. AC04]